MTFVKLHYTASKVMSRKYSNTRDKFCVTELELNLSQFADELKKGSIINHTVLGLRDKSENSCKALTKSIESRTGLVILFKKLKDMHVQVKLEKVFEVSDLFDIIW